MKKLLAVAMAGGLLLGGAGLAQAAHTDDPADHKPQDFGLCRALNNPGNHNGWYKEGHSEPGPFLDLRERADDGDDSTTDDILTFCDAATPGNK